MLEALFLEEHCVYNSGSHSDSSPLLPLSLLLISACDRTLTAVRSVDKKREAWIKNGKEIKNIKPEAILRLNEMEW